MTHTPNAHTDASEDPIEQQQSPIPIEVDYLWHTDAHPFCYDGPCDCHEDPDNIAEVHHYYQEGLLSADDATRIVQGKTL